MIFKGRAISVYSERLKKNFYIVSDDVDKALFNSDDVVYTIVDFLSFLKLKSLFPEMKIIEISKSKTTSATIPPPAEPFPDLQEPMF
jgi:hypothetical protein